MSAQIAFSTIGKTVGTSAVQFSTTTVNAPNGVYVKAAPGNSGVVYVGASNAVTAGTTDATDGYPLSAGEEVFVPINDLKKVWLIASASSQKAFALPV